MAQIAFEKAHAGRKGGSDEQEWVLMGRWTDSMRQVSGGLYHQPQMERARTRLETVQVCLSLLPIGRQHTWPRVSLDDLG